MARQVVCDRCKRVMHTERMASDIALVKLNRDGESRQQLYRCDLCDACVQCVTLAIAECMREMADGDKADIAKWKDSQRD